MSSPLWALWKFYRGLEASQYEDYRGKVPLSLHDVEGTNHQHDLITVDNDLDHQAKVPLL